MMPLSLCKKDDKQMHEVKMIDVIKYIDSRVER